MPFQACLVYITAKNGEQAAALGRMLVEKRLAAGVNIFPAIRSIYWWQGSIADESEAVCVVKTNAALFDELQIAVCSMHTYETPCIVAVPVILGSEPFLGWIDTQTNNPCST